MKKILMLLPLLCMGTFAQAQNAPVPTTSLPEIQHTPQNQLAVSDIQITPNMKCQDFVKTEKYDNQINQDKNAVRDHINQLGMILSPYYVRDQRGKIYQPALGYLVLNISTYCDSHPDSTLIDSVKQSAQSLIKLVESANKETALDIQNRQQNLGK